MSQSKGKFHYGFLILFACCAVCFSSTTLSFNTASIFYTPVSEELGIGSGLFGTYMTVQYAAMCVFMVFSGRIFKKYDARIVLSACVVVISAALISMSRFDALWQFYIAGAFLGIANAIPLYLMVPTMIDRWFKKNVGLFIGVGLAFTGIGAMVFNPIGGFIIQNYGWRMGYFAFGVISLVIALPCTLFLIRSYPADKGLLRFGETADDSISAAEVMAKPLAGMTLKQALRTPLLYTCALYAGLVDCGITLNYYLASMVMSLDPAYTVIIASTVAASVQAGQLIGKMLLGVINDFSIKAGVFSTITFGVVGIGLITFFGAQGLWILYVGGFIFGMYFAGATVTTSVMTRGFFGSLDYTRIFSIVAVVATAGSAFSSGIWGMLHEVTGSYSATFTVGLGFICCIYIVGIVCFALAKRTHVPGTDEETERVSDSAFAEVAE